MYDELVKTLRLRAALWEKMYDEDNVLKQAADAIEELSKPRWIPVTERLPEQEKKVLVTGIEAIGNVQIYGVKQLDGDVWRPTSAPSCYWEHWMPLPEPPKEE